MRLVAINEAEAVIETFFNLRESVDPSGGNGRLDHYHITTDDTLPNSGAKICWHALAVNLQTPGATLSLERDCDLCIAGYDILRLFASVTSDLTFTITAVIDGEERTLADNVVGTDTTEDYDFPLSGERMTHLSVLKAGR